MLDEITLIIPAKSEKESLPKVLDKLNIYKFKYLIILSKEDNDTIKVIEKYNPKIIYQKSFGYGDALIEGIKNVQTRYLVIFNADGSFKLEEIEPMYKKIKSENLDLVFASRYKSSNSGSEDDTILTYIGNKIFTYIGKIFFSLSISDILYTFAIADTKEIQMLNLTQKDFRLCVELPIKAKKNNLKVSDIDAYELKRIGGTKKVNELKDGFLILIHMIYLFFKKWKINF